MVELSKVTKAQRANLEALECPTFESKPWVEGGPLSQRRIAMISTAGIHRREDAHFRGSDQGYRAIPHDTDPNDIVMSHISVGYDRTAFQQDLDAIFPRKHLSDLVDEGAIGSIGSTHYSFMGGTDAASLVDNARKVAGLLKADNVDSVVLLPV